MDSGLTLKATKLRGIDSFGMLCSKSECGAEEESKEYGSLINRLSRT